MEPDIFCFFKYLIVKPIFLVFTVFGDGISGDVQRGCLSVENERVGCLATGTPSSSFPCKAGEGIAQGRFDLG